MRPIAATAPGLLVLLVASFNGAALSLRAGYNPEIGSLGFVSQLGLALSPRL